MDHDRLFKKLVTAFPLEFLQLFVPELAQEVDAGSLAFLDKELFAERGSGRRREADVVMRARLQDERAFFIVHLEHQAQRQSGLARRMYRYFSLLHERYDLPVYPIALLSYTKPRKLQAETYRVEVAGLEALLFRFRVIQLNSLNWHDYADGMNPVADALMTRMVTRPADRPIARLACLRMFARLSPGLPEASARIILLFIDQYLKLSEEEDVVFQKELQKLPQTDQEAVMEIRTSWEEKGWQEGRQEGLHQAARHSVKAVLETRFGAVPGGLAGQLDNIEDDDLLLGFVRTAASCRSLEEFSQRVQSALEQPGL